MTKENRGDRQAAPAVQVVEMPPGFFLQVRLGIRGEVREETLPKVESRGSLLQ
jgi:hypothetical protein